MLFYRFAIDRVSIVACVSIFGCLLSGCFYASKTLFRYRIHCLFVDMLAYHHHHLSSCIRLSCLLVIQSLPFQSIQMLTLHCLVSIGFSFLLFTCRVITYRFFACLLSVFVIRRRCALVSLSVTLLPRTFTLSAMLLHFAAALRCTELC